MWTEFTFVDFKVLDCGSLQNCPLAMRGAVLLPFYLLIFHIIFFYQIFCCLTSVSWGADCLSHQLAVPACLSAAWGCAGSSGDQCWCCCAPSSGPRDAALVVSLCHEQRGQRGWGCFCCWAGLGLGPWAQPSPAGHLPASHPQRWMDKHVTMQSWQPLWSWFFTAAPGVLRLNVLSHCVCVHFQAGADLSRGCN